MLFINYTVFHLHDDYSNCNGYSDSCTSYKNFIKLAKSQGMTAIAFSNHGNIYDWVLKKKMCDSVGIKYIHGVELYLCNDLKDDFRGWHICLYAKNLDGVKELNKLVSLASSKGKLEDKSDRHFYFHPRISIDELFQTSANIIVTTACLQSILSRLYFKSKHNIDIQNLIHSFLGYMSQHKNKYFLEIQYHNHPEQIEYNQFLYKMSKIYNLRLIAGTDTHSSNYYKAECRKILQKSKSSFYGDEDAFDLTWKSYSELVEAFKIQNALPETVYTEAINNTNVFADLIENFDLDLSFKYPNLYGSEASKLLKLAINKKYQYKITNGIIKTDLSLYLERIRHEYDAFEKQGMQSFILFMSELVDYCNANNIPYGFCRGSVGGSLIAYILDIIDVDAIQWGTVFSRFCNADRISLGDIDMDFDPYDRKKVYEWIISKFTSPKTSYIAQFGTLKDRATIDVLTKGLEYENLDNVMNIKNNYESILHDYSKILLEEVNFEEHDEINGIDFDYHDEYINIIRNQNAIHTLNILKSKIDWLKSEHKDLFYYFEGIKGTIISKGNHPCGIIGSPITLADNLGVFYKDGDITKPVSVCAMKAVDYLNFVKFDILGLKTIGIISDTYKYINSHYLKSHEIDWNDDKVWDNMIEHKVGVFQFEGSDYAHDLLKQFKPRKINDMSLVNASLRPSGASYRDRLMQKEFNKNPSEIIDNLLKDNWGFLVYQEDTIKFLTEICGFTGSMADSTRKAIGKKDICLLNEQLPKIIEGYCNTSNKPRDIAEQEVKQFIQIISDSSNYQFGFNHSTGYSMNGYACVRLRTYFPLEFTTAYLNRADNEDDLKAGWELAKYYGFKLVPIKFRHSNNNYSFNKVTQSIYKGLSSVKGFGTKHDLAGELLQFKDKVYDNFFELLSDIKQNTRIDSGQIQILIKLDFFNEFGHINQLLNFFDIFQNLYGRKEIKKDKLLDLKLNETIMKNIEKKETEKMYKNFNSMELMISAGNHSNYKNTNPLKKLIYEFEYYGYMQSIYNAPDNIYIISHIDTKYTPKLNAYNISTGEERVFKIYKNKFYSKANYDNPISTELIQLFDVIHILSIKEKNKAIKINNEWVETDEKEYFIENFKLVFSNST